MNRPRILVFLHEDGWAVQHEGRDFLDHLTGENKGAAEELARDMAQREGGELVVLDEHGGEVSRETFRPTPHPPTG